VAPTLASCATKEWYAEKQVCTNQYIAQIPPNFQTQPIQLTRAIQVPNGVTNCFTTGYGYTATTTCHQGTRTEYVPYTSYISVDTNKPQRDALISSCIQQACYSKFGNGDCKTGR
jgi:hypothetical protein